MYGDGDDVNDVDDDEDDDDNDDDDDDDDDDDNDDDRIKALRLYSRFIVHSSAVELEGHVSCINSHRNGSNSGRGGLEITLATLLDVSVS